jgi:hypothetical protein
MIIINQAQTCNSAAPNSAYVSRQKAQGQTAQHSEAVNWFPMTAKKGFQGRWPSFQVSGQGQLADTAVSSEINAELLE